MASKKKRRGRWVWLLPAWGLTAAAVAAAWVAFTWPRVSALAADNPESTAFIEVARARGDHVEWRWVPYDRISLEVKKAVVAAEDMSFFSHHCFDTHELKIAARDAVQGKRVRGASTITQQLAKNLWLSPSRSPLRKIRELVLTRRLEKHISKQRILELYLNAVPTSVIVSAASWVPMETPRSSLTAVRPCAMTR